MSHSSTPTPSAKGGPVLREHSFDGIQEFDQKLPNWWLFTFYIAIAIFLVYWLLFYSTSLFDSPSKRIEVAMERIDLKKKQELESMLSSLDNEVLFTWSQNASIVEEGKAIFSNNCVACHGVDLKGSSMGRSLMDAHWEHGGKPMELFQLVLEGTPQGAQGFQGQKMQSWRDQLGADGVAKVVAYVMSQSPTVER